MLLYFTCLDFFPPSSELLTFLRHCLVAGGEEGRECQGKERRLGVVVVVWEWGKGMQEVAGEGSMASNTLEKEAFNSQDGLLGGGLAWPGEAVLSMGRLSWPCLHDAVSIDCPVSLSRLALVSFTSKMP